VSAANPEQRLRNLFAASTPSHPLFQDLTLIGVFPTLFDAYFGVELPRPRETMFTGGPRPVRPRPDQSVTLGQYHPDGPSCGPRPSTSFHGT
jgi:hypothetical protein